MGGKRWKIVTIRGIPVFVGSSWVLIAAIYVWGQYIGLTQGSAGEEPSTAAILAVLTGVLFFGSVLIHEGAHAAMARRLDLPVSGITLVFWGGATETRANARGALGEFLVAFVGPFSTLLMAGVFWIGAQLTGDTLHVILRYLSVLSLFFAAMNTLPGFPLDGGRMLLAVVWGVTKSRRTALRVAGYVGIAVGVALLGAAAWSFTRSDDAFFAIFLGYLGFVMLATGRGMDQRIAFRDQLARGRAADVMRPPPTAVPADMTLTEALDHALRSDEAGAFPVVEADGTVIGTVSMTSARRVGTRDPMRPVRDATIPLNQTPVIAPDESLEETLEWLSGREGLVLQDGRLVGAVGPGDVERWYRREIEGRPMDASAPVAGGDPPPRPDQDDF
jgi:Zn-dependent protease